MNKGIKMHPPHSFMNELVLNVPVLEISLPAVCGETLCAAADERTVMVVQLYKSFSDQC